MGDLVILPIKPDACESYLSTLAGGRDTMAGCLARIQEICPIPWEVWTYVDAKHTRDALLMSGVTAGNLNKHLSALRGVLKEAARIYPDNASSLLLAATVKGAKVQRMPKGREIPLAELARLFAVASPRDAALLAILYAGGLRESEVCDLDLADWHNGCLEVRHGKGDKARTVPVVAKSECLESWCRVRGSEPGPLLYRLNRWGEPLPKRLSRRGVYDILETLCAKAAIQRYRPHDLRHTFITQLRRGGVDITLRQKLAGHADVSTTALYDVNNVDELRAAAERLPLP